MINVYHQNGRYFELDSSESKWAVIRLNIKSAVQSLEMNGMSTLDLVAKSWSVFYSGHLKSDPLANSDRSI